MTSRPVFLTVLLALVMLAGCGTSPKANFYTLGPDAAPMQGQPSFSVAISAVTVPDILDRPQMVLRSGANQVVINDFERWAGTLKSEIARAIADNLTQMLNGAIVFAYPQGANLTADYKVYIDIQRFDSALGDAATVEVLWQVRPAKGEPKNGRSAVHEATGGAGYEALVAAHNRALAAVSRDIANAIGAAGAASK